MQRHFTLLTSIPWTLPDDLELLLKDVSPGKITGVTETELRALVDEPLVRAALEKFSGRIVGIEISKPLAQLELF